MLTGVSQVDITPEPGSELQGFAVREQPSDGVADRLSLRVLYLENPEMRFLWLVFDLIGYEVTYALELRKLLALEFNLPIASVCVGFTHTHSGPGTSHLNCCGKRDYAYIEKIKVKAVAAVKDAISSVVPTEVFFAEKHCNLGVHRGVTGKQHTDKRIPVIGFRRQDGEFVAVFLSFGMHPVLLNGTHISADWPG